MMQNGTRQGRKENFQKVIVFANTLRDIIEGSNDEMGEYISKRRWNKTLEVQETDNETLAKNIINYDNSKPRANTSFSNKIPMYPKDFLNKITEIAFNHCFEKICVLKDLELHWDDFVFEKMVRELGMGYVDAFFTFKDLHFFFKEKYLVIELETEWGSITVRKNYYI